MPKLVHLGQVPAAGQGPCRWRRRNPDHERRWRRTAI